MVLVNLRQCLTQGLLQEPATNEPSALVPYQPQGAPGVERMGLMAMVLLPGDCSWPVVLLHCFPPAGHSLSAHRAAAGLLADVSISPWLLHLLQAHPRIQLAPDCSVDMLQLFAQHIATLRAVEDTELGTCLLRCAAGLCASSCPAQLGCSTLGATCPQPATERCSTRGPSWQLCAG